MSGYVSTQIAKELRKRRIETLAEYGKRVGVNVPASMQQENDDPCRWTTSTVVHILERGEYTRYIVNFKCHKKFYKSKKWVKNDPFEWAIFEGAHEAIIKLEVYDTVQKIRDGRRLQTQWVKRPVLSGIIYCADCRHKLYQVRGRYLPHSVYMIYARNHEDKFLQLVTRNSEKAFDRELLDCQKEYEQAKARIAKLVTLIQRIYEDNVEGKISDERFAKLSGNYETEHAQL